MSRTIALFASVAVVALISGCGGSDGDATDSSSAPTVVSVDTSIDTPVETAAPDETVTTDGASSNATEADFVAAFATNYALFDDDDANTCMGQAFVDFIGLDQLREQGTTPADFDGFILLEDAGLTVSPDDLPRAIADLSSCGDLATIALESSSAPPEQTACAAEIVTNDLAAEQLLVQLSSLEPSAELAAAREALQVCAAG